MIDAGPQTYYEVLELNPDATPQDVRAAYLRAKAAYKKDSVALYTLISPEETDALLHKIEEAYQVLSNPDRRKDYDRSHGLLDMEEPSSSAVNPAVVDSPFGMEDDNINVVSIDRVPPMESFGSEGDPLIAPSTDFSSHANQTAQHTHVPTPVAPPTVQAPVQPTAQPPVMTAVMNPMSSLSSSAPAVDELSISQEIAEETEWKGPFFRKIREARHVSVEEMCDYTKISKNYLMAIEDENFEKLPAPVYLRGFVIQIARYLKLPYEKVAQAYMARNSQWRDAAQSKGKPRDRLR